MSIQLRTAIAAMCDCGEEIIRICPESALICQITEKADNDSGYPEFYAKPLGFRHSVFPPIAFKEERWREYAIENEIEDVFLLQCNDKEKPLAIGMKIDIVLGNEAEGDPYETIKRNCDDVHPLERFYFSDTQNRSEFINREVVFKQQSPAALSSEKNIILYGPPGTGKTYHSIDCAVQLCEGTFDPENYGFHERNLELFSKTYRNQIQFVTFHQSYSYEEFIGGIKPRITGSAPTNKPDKKPDEADGSANGELEFEYHRGVFQEFCAKARACKDASFVFIIDEINRGNMSKIFGELITLIEESKREGASEALSVKLPYSGEVFSVPSNVYILGTMNTADRSIALLDTALRRRFHFIEMMPEYRELKTIEGVNLCNLLYGMNKRIEALYDREHVIGHAYFIGVTDLDGLDEVFKHKILPLLQEYFFDDYSKIALVLNQAMNERPSESSQGTTSGNADENATVGFIKRADAASKLFSNSAAEAERVLDTYRYELDPEIWNDDNQVARIAAYQSVCLPYDQEAEDGATG